MESIVKLEVSPPAMNAKATIDVVQIPHNGFGVGIVTLPLMLTTDFGNVTSGSEGHLTRVPDVRNNKYAASHQVARTYRKLVDLGEMNPEQNPRDRYQQRGPYYMYRLSEDARRYLPDMLNEHFVRAEGAGRVYGTAFIFKVRVPASQSKSGEVEYQDLDQNFIDSAFKGRGLSASESLKWLSRQ